MSGSRSKRKNSPRERRLLLAPERRGTSPSSRGRTRVVAGPGGRTWTAYRRSMCAFTCVPSPTRKRPPVVSASSQAICAVIIGLRGNATAIAVPRSIPSIASAAAAQLRYAVRPPSNSHRPPKPAPFDRARRAPASGATVLGSADGVESHSGPPGSTGRGSGGAALAGGGKPRACHYHRRPCRSPSSDPAGSAARRRCAGSSPRRASRSTTSWRRCS